MSWVAVFWILYGVGSTLFVVYLFKLGQTVASNRKELVQQEIERIRNEGAATPTGFNKVNTRAASPESGTDHTNRLHFQRVYQPDEAHVAIQGEHDGATCVLNLPVGEAAGLAQPDPIARSSVEKVS